MLRTEFDTFSSGQLTVAKTLDETTELYCSVIERKSNCQQNKHLWNVQWKAPAKNCRETTSDLCIYHKTTRQSFKSQLLEKFASFHMVNPLLFSMKTSHVKYKDLFIVLRAKRLFASTCAIFFSHRRWYAFMTITEELKKTTHEEEQINSKLNYYTTQLAQRIKILYFELPSKICDP